VIPIHDDGCEGIPCTCKPKTLKEFIQQNKQREKVTELIPDFEVEEELDPEFDRDQFGCA